MAAVHQHRTRRDGVVEQSVGASGAQPGAVDGTYGSGARPLTCASGVTMRLRKAQSMSKPEIVTLRCLGDVYVSVHAQSIPRRAAGCGERAKESAAALRRVDAGCGTADHGAQRYHQGVSGARPNEELEGYLAEVMIGPPEQVEIRICDYDPAWPERFAREAARIRDASATGSCASSTSAPPRCPASPPSRSSTSCSCSTTPPPRPRTCLRSRPPGTSCACASDFPSTACCAPAAGRPRPRLPAGLTGDRPLPAVPRPPARGRRRARAVRAGQTPPRRARLADHAALRRGQDRGRRGDHRAGRRRTRRG